jgi:ketosteroid isomerase-like protein
MNVRISVIVLLIALVVTAVPSHAQESTAAVMATVHRFVDGFNKGDVKSALAACATPASIIDEFPPHYWQGPNACADWARDYDVLNKRLGITDGIVTLERPSHVDVSANRAYVVIPVAFTYKEHGKRTSESGSIFTLVLQKNAAGWRIAAWAWAKH